MKNKSIGQKLQNVNSYQSQQGLLSNWAKGWKEDQELMLKKLKLATRHDNYEDIMSIIQQMEGMTKNRFSALNNVLCTLSDPQRVLKDLSVEKVDGMVKDAVPASNENKAVVETVSLNPVKNKIEKETKLEVEEIVKSYKSGITVKEIAEIVGISYNKVIKLLVTEGVYTSNTFDKIQELRERGCSEQEISDICGLGKSAMWQYTPYKRGVYYSENPTDNALRLREWRACKSL